MSMVPPRPWSLAPLKGKYYGTKIVDANGEEVLDIWLGYERFGLPEEADDFSPREEITEEEIKGGWVDYTHSEKRLDYETALAIVEGVNAL